MLIGSIGNAFMNEHNGGFVNCHHGCSDLPGCDSDVDRGHGMDFRHVYGTQAQIMQSAEDADKVIALFESAIMQGYHPNDVEQEVYRQANVNPSDFTWYDKQKIQRKVEEIYKSKGSRY